MSINFTYSFDLASAFIIGLILGLLLRQCEPEPPKQEAKTPPVSEREPHVVVDNRRAG